MQKNMYKGTMTPNENGGYNIELHEPSSGILGWAIKLGTAAALGAFTYLGNYAASKIAEAAENKKKPKK